MAPRQLVIDAIGPVFTNIPTLEDENTTLSRHVGHQSPRDAAQHAGRTANSNFNEFLAYSGTSVSGIIVPDLCVCVCARARACACVSPHGNSGTGRPIFLKNCMPLKANPRQNFLVS